MSYKKSTTKKSLQKYSVSDREFLNKRLKTSTHYAKVKSKTNSGFNATRREEVEREIRRYYRVRNDEVFQRISLGDLLHLMVIYAEECNLTRLAMPGKCLDRVAYEEEEDEGAKVKEEKPEEANDKAEKKISLKFKDDIHEVVHKMDELDFVLPVPHGIEDRPTCPFLLLDVRSGNEFARGHLSTAVCHPHARLSRAVGWECPEMLTYKNHPDWIIVVYDDNETQSPEVATILIHRGYTNVFVLSGGLKLARDKIGSPLVTTNRERDLSPAVANFLAEKNSSVLIPPLRMVDAASWWAAKTASKQSRSRWESLDTLLGVSRGGRFASREKTPDEKKQPWR